MNRNRESEATKSANMQFPGPHNQVNTAVHVDVFTTRAILIQTCTQWRKPILICDIVVKCKMHHTLSLSSDTAVNIVPL